jgi:asparagine synthase (glutamine-hydrolysing)
VRSLLDLKMWADLTYATVDSNYRVPDVSGLQAQVEVRSPYLDHRMVEFAAALPPSQKVSRPLHRPMSKALPKRVYARFISRDVAYTRKKGMAANVHWDRDIADNPAFGSTFAAAYDALDEAGIGSAGARSAHRAFMDDRARGRLGSQHGGRMMAGFMLGRWLQRTARRATAATIAG